MRPSLSIVTTVTALLVAATAFDAAAQANTGGNPLSLEEIARLAAGQQAPAGPAPTISCNRPKDPARPPLGAKATEAEMQAAQTAIKTFVAEAQSFQACVATAQREAYPRLTVMEYMALESLINQMQARIEGYAAAFNEQVRVYRAANPAKK